MTLSAQKVEQIKKLYIESDLSLREMAREIGCHHQTIKNVIKRLVKDESYLKQINQPTEDYR